MASSWIKVEVITPDKRYSVSSFAYGHGRISRLSTVTLAALQKECLTVSLLLQGSLMH